MQLRGLVTLVEIIQRLFFWPEFLALAVHHMFIVNPAGTLIYDRAIDNKATMDQAESRALKTMSDRLSKKRWRASP
jgi:hypothetical protein